MIRKKVILGILVLVLASGSYSQEVNKEKVLKDILPGVLKRLNLCIVYSTEVSKEPPDSLVNDTTLMKNNPEKYFSNIDKFDDQYIYYPDSIDCLAKNYTYVITVYDTLYKYTREYMRLWHKKISNADSLNVYSTILPKYFNNTYKDKEHIEFDSLQIGDCYLTVNKRLTEDNFYKYGNFYLGSLFFTNIYVNYKVNRAVISCSYVFQGDIWGHYIYLWKKEGDWKIEYFK